MQMAEAARLSKALVRKETINMIEKIQAHLTDSPFTATIQKRADTLLQRLNLSQS